MLVGVEIILVLASMFLVRILLINMSLQEKILELIIFLSNASEVSYVV